MFLQVGAMRRNTWVLVLLAVVAAVAGSRLTAGVAAAQEFPPQPVIYSGAVTVSSGEDPDGFFVTARVLDYEASPVEVVSGAYSALIVSLPDNTYANLTLTFHLDGQQALETDTSLAPGLPLPKSNFNLTFAKLPDPTPTPTPVVVTPAVYSGAIVVAGSQPPAQAQLTARIGSYETTSISTNGPVFTNLVIAPPDDSAIGQPIQFFLNGFPSAPPAPPAIFQPGEFKTVNLIFVSFPEPTPTPPPPTRHATATATADADADAASHRNADTANGDANTAHADADTPDRDARPTHADGDEGSVTGRGGCGCDSHCCPAAIADAYPRTLGWRVQRAIGERIGPDRPRQHAAPGGAYSADRRLSEAAPVAKAQKA